MRRASRYPGRTRRWPVASLMKTCCRSRVRGTRGIARQATTSVLRPEGASRLHGSSRAVRDADRVGRPSRPRRCRRRGRRRGDPVHRPVRGEAGTPGPDRDRTPDERDAPASKMSEVDQRSPMGGRACPRVRGRLGAAPTQWPPMTACHARRGLRRRVASRTRSRPSGRRRDGVGLEPGGQRPVEVILAVMRSTPWRRSGRSSASSAARRAVEAGAGGT